MHRPQRLCLNPQTSPAALTSGQTHPRFEAEKQKENGRLGRRSGRFSAKKRAKTAGYVYSKVNIVRCFRVHSIYLASILFTL
jgi:hypothetical protein